MNSLALIFSVVVVAVSAQYHQSPSYNSAPAPSYGQASAGHAPSYGQASPSYGKGGEATSFQTFRLEVGNQEYKQPSYESQKPSYNSEPSYHHSGPSYHQAPAPAYKPSYPSAPSYSKPAYKPSY